MNKTILSTTTYDLYVTAPLGAQYCYPIQVTEVQRGSLSAEHQQPADCGARDVDYWSPLFLPSSLNP